MSAVVEMKARPSVLEAMAERYGMMPSAFEATVRATVTPKDTTREEFAAFLLVAKEYKLNPLTKEIYAFPKRGGGIVPIVSIDGWTSLVNSHPSCDGFEFEFEHDEKGEVVCCTCKMYRKDRSRPVSVTEYLAECYRPTDPWKMKHRMLRHKAMIQAARYAFGFSGIYDEDEGTKIAEMRDVTPPKPPAPPEPPSSFVDHVADAIDADEPATGDVSQDFTAEIDGSVEFDANAFFEALEADLAKASTIEDLEDAWTSRDPEGVFDGDDVNIGIAKAIKNRRIKQIGGR